MSFFKTRVKVKSLALLASTLTFLNTVQAQDTPVEPTPSFKDPHQAKELKNTVMLALLLLSAVTGTLWYFCCPSFQCEGGDEIDDSITP